MYISPNEKVCYISATVENSFAGKFAIKFAGEMPKDDLKYADDTGFMVNGTVYQPLFYFKIDTEKKKLTLAQNVSGSQWVQICGETPLFGLT